MAVTIFWVRKGYFPTASFVISLIKLIYGNIDPETTLKPPFVSLVTFKKHTERASTTL